MYTVHAIRILFVIFCELFYSNNCEQNITCLSSLLCHAPYLYATPIPQGIDVKSMGRIFIGIVKCGAWGCFDEFNRLEEVVLSAVSTQIQAIQTAIKGRAPSCDLLDRKVTTSV